MYGLGVERALRAALEAHDDQVRKGTGAPYVVHPVQVALHLARLGASDNFRHLLDPGDVLANSKRQED